MQNNFNYKTERPWPNRYLKSGSLIGHTTSTSTKIWLRTGYIGNFTLLVFPETMYESQGLKQSFKQVPYTELAALPVAVRRIDFSIDDDQHDTIHVADIDALEPFTAYGYALFFADGRTPRMLLGQDRAFTFRTLPEQDDLFSFAFFSCHMPYKDSLFGNPSTVNMDMWDFLNAVLARHQNSEFRFMIAGGDQVYTDGVKSLNVWKYLNKYLDKKDGEIVPDKDAMLSWYRDVYRGYWGFPIVQRVFSSYPSYMIWDDHEIMDGWGSYYLTGEGDDKDEMDKIFPDYQERGLTYQDAKNVLSDMGESAKTAYYEYQHCHNPRPEETQFDYHFRHDTSAFYVLDGRGHRDINRASYRILGEPQFKRFKTWIEALDPADTEFLFITSAVPLLHMTPMLVNADNNVAAEMAGLQDDLRDAWEHHLHDNERKALLKLLFAAAKKGIRICVLSGDVHTSAAFRMTDAESGATLYQLTSSAISYNKPRALSWLLGQTVPDSGDSDDGYHFERLAVYTDSNFSLVKVDKRKQQVTFQLYGHQKVDHPHQDGEQQPMTHSIAKLELRF